MNTFTKIKYAAYGLVAFMVLSPFALMLIPTDKAPVNSVVITTPAVKSEAQLKEEKDKAIEEQHFQKVVKVVGKIKQSARNPSSVVWEDILGSNDGSTVCVQLRAQNGFGGMTRENVTYANGSISSSNSAWNKNCANKSLKDWNLVTYAL